MDDFMNRAVECRKLTYQLFQSISNMINNSQEIILASNASGILGYVASVVLPLVYQISLGARFIGSAVDMLIVANLLQSLDTVFCIKAFLLDVY
jgi:hypothetical protein